MEEAEAQVVEAVAEVHVDLGNLTSYEKVYFNNRLRIVFA